MNYYDSFNYGYNVPSDTMFSGILAIYFIVLMVMLLFYIISYIFKGIGMYTIAKRQGMDYPWLAFIPFARAYLHGDIAGSITLKTKKIKSPGVWVLVIPFIIGALDFIFFILFWIVGIGAFAGAVGVSVTGSVYGYESTGFSTGIITGLIVLGVIWIILQFLFQAIYKALVALVDYRILERFTTRNMSVAHAVLSVFVPLYESICFFVMRNRDFRPGMEPDPGRPFIQVPPVMPPTGGPAGGAYNTAGPQGHQIPPIEPASTANPQQPPRDTWNQGNPPEPPKDTWNQGNQPEPPKDTWNQGNPPEPPKDALNQGNPPEPPKDALNQGNPSEPPSETETPVKPQAPADNIIYAEPPKVQETPEKF